MKSLFLIVSVMLFSLGLTGCFPKPAPVVITNTKIVTKTFPDELLLVCKGSAPISVAGYMAMTLKEREAYLTKYSKLLLTDLADCNIQIDKLRDLNDKYKKESDTIVKQ